MQMQPAVETSERGAVRIRLLGGFSVSVGPRTVTDAGWRLRKARSVVKLLALTPGHRLHREQIMGLLWPGLEPAAAANNLYQALHAARRMLDDEGHGDAWLSVSNEIVALSPQRSLRVDVQAFEQAAARARRSRGPSEYRAAIDLYAGDLLPDDRFEEWALQPREDLRQTHLGLIIELAALLETRGEPAAAIELLEGAVRREPTYEEAHRRLMWLYALTGNHYRARRQYQILKDALRRDLDTEPDPQTQGLYRDIIDGRIVGTPEMQRDGAAHAVVQLALDDAYAGLSDPERALLRRLAVFAGGSTQEAIGSVCGDGIERHRLPMLLSKLVEGSLIIADHHGQEIRYRMLETVRQFALRRLDDAGETQHLRRGHRDWLVSFAERAEPELSGPDAPLWLRRLDVEHENLRAALAFCQEHDPATGARLAAALWQFWEIRGHLAEGRQWLDELLTRGGPDLAPAPRARVLLGAGTLASRQGDHRGAQPMLQTSLQLFEEIGDQWGIAWALDNLGMLVLADGELRQARTMFERSLALFERVGDRRGTACVRDNLGWTAMMEGHYDEARVQFQQALATFRECGDRRGTGRALANLANVLRQLGDLGAARTLFEESLAFCRVEGAKTSRPGPLRRWLQRSLLRMQLIAWPAALGPITLPCAGACAGLPLIVSSVASVPLWALVAHLALYPIAPLNAAALYVTYRRHRRPWPLIAGIVGGVLVIGAVTIHFMPRPYAYLHNALILPGMALLVLAFVLDWLARRRTAEVRDVDRRRGQ